MTGVSRSVLQSPIGWLILTAMAVALLGPWCSGALANENAGFKAIYLGGEGNPGPLNRRIETCDGGPVAPASKRGSISPLFQRLYPVQTVVSGVYRMASASASSQYIEAADSPRGLQCIERDNHPAGVAAPNTLAFDIRVRLGATVLRGVRTVRCFDSTTKCEGKSIMSFTDRIWFKVGSYVVMLFFVAGPSNGMMPRYALLPIEHRLLARLYQSRSRDQQSLTSEREDNCQPTSTARRACRADGCPWMTPAGWRRSSTNRVGSTAAAAG